MKQSDTAVTRACLTNNFSLAPAFLSILALHLRGPAGCNACSRSHDAHLIAPIALQGSRAAALRKTRRRLRLVLHLEDNILRCSSCMRDALVVLFNTIAAAMPPLQRFAQRSPIPFGKHLRWSQNVILPSSARSRACWARVRIASLPTEDLLKNRST